VNDDLDLRVVTTTPDGMLAAVLRGRLESAGIPTMARSYGAGGWLFPGGPSGFGPVDILVPASRLEEAEQILSETDE
jgi:Putative prokaryotic signal transducing protein